MPSKNRVKPTKGRAIPGGVGPIGLREWGPDGLHRVTMWIQSLKRENTAWEVFRRSGVSESTVKKIWYGAQDPSPAIAAKISVAFAVDLAAIVKGRAA